MIYALELWKDNAVKFIKIGKTENFYNRLNSYRNEWQKVVVLGVSYGNKDEENTAIEIIKSLSNQEPARGREYFLPTYQLRRYLGVFHDWASLSSLWSSCEFYIGELSGLISDDFVKKLFGFQSDIETMIDYFDNQSNGLFEKKYTEERMHRLVESIKLYNELLETVIEPLLASEFFHHEETPCQQYP
jgi:hypothetical protein